MLTLRKFRIRIQNYVYFVQIRTFFLANLRFICIIAFNEQKDSHDCCHSPDFVIGLGRIYAQP
jgi:hypothetical protein